MSTNQIDRQHFLYLFWRVANPFIELTTEPGVQADAEATVPIPNAARKMLAAFLSFKFPQYVGSFEESVEAAIVEYQSPLQSSGKPS